MRWYISFTEAPSGEWYAWATETQPPRNATFATMFAFPGEVHFAHGDTVEEARDRLEAELPRHAP